MIDINIDPVLLIPIINFPISWHGLFSFIGVIIAVFFVARWAPYRGVSSDTIYSIAIWAILGGFIGARIVHVVDNWDIYGQDLIRVFYFWNGGIGLWGGILGGFIGGSTYSYLKKYNYTPKNEQLRRAILEDDESLMHTLYWTCGNCNLYKNKQNSNLKINYKDDFELD